MAHPQIVIDTVQEMLAFDYRLATYCRRCKTFRDDVDLAKLTREGQGAKTPRNLEVPCPKCGARMVFTRYPPSRHKARSNGDHAGVPS